MTKAEKLGQDMDEQKMKKWNKKKKIMLFVVNAVRVDILKATAVKC